jgi:hypothetical protein
MKVSLTYSSSTTITFVLAELKIRTLREISFSGFVGNCPFLMQTVSQYIRFVIVVTAMKMSPCSSLSQNSV